MAAETAETIVGQFSPTALEDLYRNHAVVLDPFDTSLAKLVAAGRPFWHIANRNDPDFMGLLSRPSQVAFFPGPEQFYVPESNLKSLEQQRACLKADAAEVMNNRDRMGIGGVDWVIGDVATHAGLAFAHFERYGVRLHKDYSRFVRTDTPTVDSFVAHVGNFREGDYLQIYGWPAEKGYSNVWVFRLGVPAQE